MYLLLFLFLEKNNILFSISNTYKLNGRERYLLIYWRYQDTRLYKSTNKQYSLAKSWGRRGYMRPDRVNQSSAPGGRLTPGGRFTPGQLSPPDLSAARAWCSRKLGKRMEWGEEGEWWAGVVGRKEVWGEEGQIAVLAEHGAVEEDRSSSGGWGDGGAVGDRRGGVGEVVGRVGGLVEEGMGGLGGLWRLWGLVG